MTGARRVGRPRSEHAREAVLHAVDDLLVEVGYAAMTMKGIADRAGVGRQTVYRWWSTKAEVLLEACVADARDELTTATSGRPLTVVTTYLSALIHFLSGSDAGLAYRALVGEAQHDDEVARLVGAHDVLGESARVVLQAVWPSASGAQLERAAAQLIGPVFFWLLSGRDAAGLAPRTLAASFLDTLPQPRH